MHGGAWCWRGAPWSQGTWFLHLKTRGGGRDWDGVNWRKERQEREQGLCRALQDVTRTCPFL